MFPRRFLFLFFLAGCYTPGPNADRVISPNDCIQVGTGHIWRNCVVADAINLQYCSNDPDDPQIKFWSQATTEQKRTEERFWRVNGGRT